ncbi:MAG: CinA family protein [Bacilli bacterium]
MKDFSNIVKLLIKNNKTISTMESCTGGGVANAITNIEGASEVFKFGALSLVLLLIPMSIRLRWE